MNMLRRGDVEFRYSESNSLHELVQWEGERCFVIAFFRAKKEGFDMETVGERFFDAGKNAVPLARHALRFLNGMSESIDDKEFE